MADYDLMNDDLVAGPPVSAAPAAKARAPGGGWGTVKAVLSGDSVILVGKSTNPAIPPPEKTVTLSGIMAPRFSRSRATTDEPFAFQSREYLRNKLIGQNVRFNVAKKAGGREFGEIFFDGSNVTELVVRNGWANVKPTQGAESQQLQELEEKAKEVHIGIHQHGVEDDRIVRDIEWNPNTAELYEMNKDNKDGIPGIVDFVRDGSTMRIELLSSSPVLKHTMIMLHLAGVQCRRIPPPIHVRMQQYEKRKKELPPEEAAKLTPPFEEPPPKYAVEAKRFSEVRLQHRTVKVLLQGIDKAGNLFGTVVVPQGNISVLLLRHGYATFVNWSAGHTGNTPALQQAEQLARDQRLRIWKTQQARPSHVVERKADDRREFTGIVTQIYSGDTIAVQDPHNKSSQNDIRVILSSIRAPKFSNRFDKKSTTQPCAYESREALRSRLIGKKVKVCVEYRRAAPENSRNASDRIYATVWQGKQNIAEAQVASGNASVISHSISEDRSNQYQKLLDAEKRAQQKGKGIHSKSPMPVPQYIDLSERFGGNRDDMDKDEKEKRDLLSKSVVAKAKSYFEFMRADKFGKMNGIVEFVFTGHRLKILVPKQNCIVSYVLGGVDTSRAPRGTSSGSDFNLSAQATEFTRSLCLQNNVQLEVEAHDKGGNFIGQIFVNKQNLSCLLLEKGFAHVREPFRGPPRKGKYTDVMYKAQAIAQNARIGVWTDWNPEDAKAKAQEDEQTNQVEFKSKVIQVTVSDIRDAATFFVQIIGSKDLEAIENRIKDTLISEPDSNFAPKKNNQYLGQFQGEWYRCKCLGRLPQAPEEKHEQPQYRVHFIDYGNEDVVTASELREIDDESLLSFPVQSRMASLAGLRGPPQNSDYVDDAAMTFHSMVMGRPLAAQIEVEDRDMLHLTLMEQNAKDKQPTINQEISRQGWVRPAKYKDKRLSREYRAGIKKDIELAKSDHLGIWQYGDCGSDTEERM